MKKILNRAILVTVFLCIGIYLFISCTKQTSSDVNSLSSVKASSVSNATTCVSCGATYTGSHAAQGYYVYPDITLDLSCAASNAKITALCYYYDVPNYFTIKDKNGNLIATTGWIGNAACSGPWGASISSPAQSIISFNYNPANAPYVLEVATEVTACGTCSSPGCVNSDSWTCSISCAGVTGTAPDTIAVTPSCASCGAALSSNHTGKGYYKYPNVGLDLTCETANHTVQINYQYYDVPNRFTVYDKNLNVVTTSNWVGYAACSGPWGSSIYSPAYGSMSFQYNPSSAPYSLGVETVVNACNTCTTTGCTAGQDTWSATVNCK